MELWTKFNCVNNLRNFCFSIFIICVFNHGVVGLTGDGGYEIIVSIEEGTNEPVDLEQFIQNINDRFQNMSQLLHIATKEKFYINSVNLIAPYHWRFTQTSQLSAPKPETKNSYVDADIRLSSSIEAPHVENPNVCGLPGQFIELPLNFFEDFGRYGVPEKALLTAWASYRFGVHEEYGYLADRKFPYFYKKLEPGSTWEATRCGEIKGDYKSLTGESTCPLTDPSYPPGSDCRFEPTPDEIQTATASLMYLHWVDSVQGFCDSTTHNREGPSKQNILCEYKSVQEVIDQSPDAKSLQGSVPSPPKPISFTVTTASKLPLLYVLVDGGRFDMNPDMMKEILNNTKQLFTTEEFKDVIGKAAVFVRGAGGEEVIIDLKIDWTNIGEHVDNFYDAVDEFNQKYDQGNFALAIEEVIRELRVRRHRDGAILLVLKHGVSPTAFDKPAYEEDLIRILKEGNIRLHAIEIRENIINPKVHLKNLAEASGGYHTEVTPTASVTGTIRNAVREVTQQLLRMESSVGHVVSSGTLFKGFLDRNTLFPVPLHEANLPVGTVIRFSVTLDREAPYNETKSPLITMQEGAPQAQIRFESLNYEWTETANWMNRKVVTYNMSAVISSSTKVWTFLYNGCEPIEQCTGFVTVFYELAEDLEGTSRSVGKVVNPLLPLDFDVWTSVGLKGSTMDEINLKPDTQVNSVPFIVFVKITQKGSPVIGLSVTAKLHNFEQEETIIPSVFLRDDGASSIDMMEQDGIYSGSVHSGVAYGFTYRLTLDIVGLKTDLTDEDDYVHMDSAVHRIIPIDQVSLGCRSNIASCAGTGLERNLAFVVDYERTIHFTELPSFIARITDLEVQTKGNYNFVLQWKAPIYHDPGATPSYDIRFSGNGDELKTKGGFELAQSFLLPPEVTCGFGPGDICQVTVDKGDVGPIYFAVRLSLSPSAVVADPSNVVGVVPTENEPIPTTTSTTTIAPSTTEFIPSKSTHTTIETVQTESTSELPETTEPKVDITRWYETTEGIITLSVFGGGLLILGVITFVYCVCITKRTGRNRRMQPDGIPYNSFS